MADLIWQPSLFDSIPLGIDTAFKQLKRIDLDEQSWIDHAPRWVSGSDELFSAVISDENWGQRTRRMYDKEVKEPRLTRSWKLDSGKPLQPPLLEEMRLCLSDRYGVTFDSLGFNLYRDGRDSVAWHRDHIKKEISDPVVVLVSLGEPRRFLVRPYGGGASTAFMLGAGDLLVTGGKTQRTWEHAIPKVAKAGPRISLAFRHHMEARGYVDEKKPVAAKKRYRARKSTTLRL